MRSPLARAIALIVLLVSLNWKTLGDWAEEVRLLGRGHAQIRDALLESRTIYGFRPTRPWKTERRYRDLRRVIDSLEVHSDEGIVVIVTDEGLTTSERSFVQYRAQYYLYPRVVRVVGVADLPSALEGARAVAFLEVAPPSAVLGRGTPSRVPERSAVLPLAGGGQ